MLVINEQFIILQLKVRELRDAQETYIVRSKLSEEFGGTSSQR